MIRLHPYNRQIVLFNKFHIPYAPAYGWKSKFCAKCFWRKPKWTGQHKVNHKLVYFCQKCGPEIIKILEFTGDISKIEWSRIE